MSYIIKWFIITSAVVGLVNFAYLVIIDEKLREIKREISRVKIDKGSVYKEIKQGLEEAIEYERGNK